MTDSSPPSAEPAPEQAQLLTRRRLLLGASAVAAVGAAHALGLEPRWLETSEHQIAVPKLASALEGFVIAQLSDAHLTELGMIEQAVVDAVRARPPNLIVLTGDIIESEHRLGVLAELCRELRTASGSVAMVGTLGNREPRGNLGRQRQNANNKKVRVKLLVNESAELGGIAVAATDDGLGGLPRWDTTLRNLSKNGPKLLLTHSPALVDEAPSTGPQFDLALAGHTHGGQLRLGPWAPLCPPGSGRFTAGHYDTAMGRLYVSRGIGTSVVPARLMCRPELPSFELRRA